MFDKEASEFSKDWIPDGFSVKKARRPVKDVPEWVLSDKKLLTKLCKDVKLKYQVAYLHWRLGWTSREIANELLGRPDKFKSIESMIYRLKQM